MQTILTTPRLVSTKVLMMTTGLVDFVYRLKYLPSLVGYLFHNFPNPLILHSALKFVSLLVTLGCVRWLSFSWKTRCSWPISARIGAQAWAKLQRKLLSHYKGVKKIIEKRKVDYANIEREVKTVSCCSKKCINSVLTVSHTYETREYLYQAQYRIEFSNLFWYYAWSYVTDLGRF